ncbi:MAG: MFS transporter [Phycisphaerales bacterium]
MDARGPSRGAGTGGRAEDSPGERHAPHEPPAVDPAGDEPDSAGARGADIAPLKPAVGHTRWEVLRHRHFRNIWIAAFFSWIGTWMENTGVSWVMGQATLAKSWTDKGYPDAPTMMAWHAVAQLGPTLVLGLIGGAVADRMNRKTLLIATQVMLMLTAAALAACAWLDVLNPWVLLGVGFAYGCIVAFNIPAWQVLTPRLVPKDELPSAIMLNGMMFNLARALGPVAAGWLMGMTNATWLFVINTASFVGVISVACTTPDAPAPKDQSPSHWHDVREAWGYAFSHTGTRVLIIGIAISSMLSTPMLRMLPLLVSEVYPGSRVFPLPGEYKELAYGMLLGFMGGGAVLGGILMRLVPAWYPRHHLVPVSVTLCGLSLLGLGLCTDFIAAMLVMVPVGIFWMWSFNSAMGALQMSLDDRLRGRVLAICNVISFGSMPLGSFVAAWSTDVAGMFTSHAVALQWGVLAPSAALGIVGLWMLRHRTPEIDNLHPGDPGYDRTPGLLRGVMATAHRPGRV